METTSHITVETSACGPTCGCCSSPPATTQAATARSPASNAADPPVVCTLGAGDIAERLEQWDAALVHVRAREAIDGGLRLWFEDTTAVDQIAEVMVAEWECCRFYSFTLTVDQRGMALEIRAPAEAQDVLQALFGSSATRSTW